MTNVMKKSTAIVVASIFPMWSYAFSNADRFNSGATLISICNFILLITSVICIFQYFFLNAEEHVRFQVLNMIGVLVFYWVSLHFLIDHKQYYDDYDDASRNAIIKGIFITPSRYVLKHWIILFALILNVLYLIRYQRLQSYES
ncbi:MAG: hypothetical protein JWQ38_971 [Flavipsychrobacter sp.]|nr:hypothetical protein [Flavipsychrobacter sp.]